MISMLYEVDQQT